MFCWCVQGLPRRDPQHEGVCGAHSDPHPRHQHPHAPLHPQVQPHHARLPTRGQLHKEVCVPTHITIYCINFFNSSST